MSDREFVAATGALAWTFRTGGERPRASELARIALGGLAPLAALGGFMAYLHARTGDALAFLHIQTAWRRSLSTPFAGLLQGLVKPSSVHDADLLSFAFAWLAIRAYRNEPQPA